MLNIDVLPVKLTLVLTKEQKHGRPSIFYKFKQQSRLYFHFSSKKPVVVPAEKCQIGGLPLASLKTGINLFLQVVVKYIKY